MKSEFDFAKAEVISMFINSVKRTARYEDEMYSTINEDEKEHFDKWRKNSLLEENTLYDVLSLAFNMKDDEIEAIAINAKRNR